MASSQIGNINSHVQRKCYHNKLASGSVFPSVSKNAQCGSNPDGAALVSCLDAVGLLATFVFNVVVFFNDEFLCLFVYLPRKYMLSEIVIDSFRCFCFTSCWLSHTNGWVMVVEQNS